MVLSNHNRHGFFRSFCMLTLEVKIPMYFAVQLIDITLRERRPGFRFDWREGWGCSFDCR